MTRFKWTGDDRAKLVPGATVELVDMGRVLGKDGRYTVHRLDPTGALWVAGGDVGVALSFHADPSSILPPSDQVAERDEARRHLAAEQAAHARFVQRISRALGDDYTGSFEDACIGRLEAFAATRAALEAEHDAHNRALREHLVLLDENSALRKQVHQLKGDVHAAGIDGERIGRGVGIAQAAAYVENLDDWGMRELAKSIRRLEHG